MQYILMFICSTEEVSEVKYSSLQGKKSFTKTMVQRAKWNYLL